MCLLKLFRPWAKKKTAPVETELPEEEYQLPLLSKGNVPMTESLRRRQQNEQLKQKYGIRTEKEGTFV